VHDVHANNVGGATARRARALDLTPLARESDQASRVFAQARSLLGTRSMRADAASLSRPPAAGDVLDGRYRIVRPIARGGMATVFLAEHTLIKRRLVIKLLHAELAHDRSTIERFMTESLAAGTLGHPNIVQATDMGLANGRPYIVFDYLEGCVLAEEIYRVGGLPLRRALDIALQIASALDAAHGAEIVHLDLNSGNVMLTHPCDAFEHVNVLDFDRCIAHAARCDRDRRADDA
jgi:serine/threonine protein kinase